MSPENEDILNFKYHFIEKIGLLMSRHDLKAIHLANILNISDDKISRYRNPKHPSIPDVDFFLKLKSNFPLEIDLNDWIDIPRSDRKQSKGLNKKQSERTWNQILDLDEGESIYLSEDPKSYKYFTQKIMDLEVKSERIYFSNIFPSGIFRFNSQKKDKVGKQLELNRYKKLKNSKKVFREYYTLESFLRFCFGITGERFSSWYELFITLDRINDFLLNPSGERGIYLIDTSKKEERDNEYFYGYPITRLVNEDYIVTSDLNRTYRFERNPNRYNSIKIDLENLSDKYDIRFSILLLLNILKESVNTKKENSSRPTRESKIRIWEMFRRELKKNIQIEAEDFSKACFRNIIS
ncbi:MAG: hypothetical protein KDK54_19005 [Leptospiraceae bacterium]|nr:hypothetical protein [Leptospiraceae bacterium]